MQSGAATNGGTRLRAWARGLLLATAALSGSGCVTASMWRQWPDHHCDGDLDWNDGGTVAAVAMTPVTVAVDAAIVVSVAWLLLATDSGCGDGFTIDFD